MEPTIGLIISYTTGALYLIILTILFIKAKKELKEKSKKIFAFEKQVKYYIEYISELKEKIKQKENTINQSFIIAENLTNKIETQRSRLLDLEKTVEEGYGIKVRNEITEIICDYSKLETVIIYSGIHKLLKASQNVEDSKMMIKLIEKIEKVMPDMKEEEEKKEEPTQQGN